MTGALPRREIGEDFLEPGSLRHVQEVFGWMSQVILALALPYFSISLTLGIRVAHRNGMRLDSQESGFDVEQSNGTSHQLVYLLVRCLNEDVVIGEVSRLLTESECTVIVIDDGSSDQTAWQARDAVAERGHRRRLIVLSRSGDQSRHGRGAALNAAFPMIVRDLEAQGSTPRTSKSR